MKHLWLDAGYQARGKQWAEEVMGLSVEVVRKPPKPVPEKVAKIWAEEWAIKKARRSIGRGSCRSGAFECCLEKVGCGADILLVRTEQTDEQGLREAVRQRRSVCLRCDDTADGETVGPCLRISRQSLEAAFSEVRIAAVRHPWLSW
jgi:hypothetical protein